MLANFMLFALMRNAPGLYEDFGFTKGRPAFISFVLFQYLVTPVDEVGSAAHTRWLPVVVCCWADDGLGA